MKQSPNDLKKYRSLTLDNGLRVLLVHNEETDKSAAALAINIGHFNDPYDRQGLAHFLEHMLFLGTKKYPDGNEYQKFISQHGGSNNAWTATEHTCFYFDIHHKQFVEALDRFSQFFISPLLTDEFIISERKNIEAEFKLKLKDDIRRLYDVHKATINQRHPFSKFSVGNIDTLNDINGESISKEVNAFFNLYYQASYMTLAIEGPQKLDDLELLAKKMFSAIKNNKSDLPPITEPLYLPEHQGIYLKIKPVKNDNQLIISFAMESIDKFYQDKPETILAYLIGHEGPGSILARLKQQQWATGLSAGSGINGSNFKDFNISIRLTERGETCIDDIISIVFSYIGLLKSAKLPLIYYQEKQAIAELSFTYYEKSSPLDNVNQLVINMQHYPCEDYIFGDYIMSGMKNKNIKLLLDYLNTDNMRVIHISQNNSFSQKSHWYQVPYHVSKIPDENLINWYNLSTPSNANYKINQSLFLPQANTYITGNPYIYNNSNQKVDKNPLPIKIEDSNGLAVWYKQDTTFRVPKGYIYVGIDSQNSTESIETIAMTRLFVELYTNTVVEENYDAELSGIHYHLYAHQGGFTLQLSGISENQPKLLEKLLYRLTHHETTEDNFDLFKQQLIKHWQNSDKSKSISQLFSSLSSLMQPSNPSADELSVKLTNISFKQYQHFYQQLFKKINLEVLIYGNWLINHAANIITNIKQAFANNYSNEYAAQSPVVDISNQKTIIIPKEIPDHDNASVLYTPLATRDKNLVALAMVTSHLLSPLFFQTMRTEKQYGYLVGIGYVPINRYPGIAFYIQSPHIDSIKLTKAIDEFITDSLEMLNDINEENWLQLINGLARQLQEKDNNLRIKSQRYWAAICNKDLFFSNKEQLITAILSLKINQVENFIKSSLMAKSIPDRIILSSIKIINPSLLKKMEYELNGKIINNIDSFIKKSKRKY